MKAITLICITIVLGVLIMQDVDGGKIVSEKKLKNWGKKNEGINEKTIDLRRESLKNNSQLKKHKHKLQDLLEVIQYVITDAINNQEFRTFLIKRFLHNYVPQASKYLDTIKELKKKINPESVKEDDENDEAMKKQ